MKKLLLLLVLVFIATPFFAQNLKFGKVSKEELEQKSHPDQPDADAAILFREIKSEFMYNQGSGWVLLTHYYERIKIYNKDGLSYADKSIRLYKGKGEDKVVGLKGNTYNLTDGKIDRIKLKKEGIFKEDISKYQNATKFVMPDVREGSVIEYEYTVQSPFIMSIDEWRLQELIPIDKLSFEFKAPEYFVYQPYQRGGIDINMMKDSRMRKITLDIGGKAQNEYRNNQYSRFQDVEVKENIITIELEQVPALKFEPYAGNLTNYGAAVQFELSYVDQPGNPVKNFAISWEDVSKVINKDDSFGAEINRSGYFEKDIDALLAGVYDPMEKAHRILRYVATKIDWNGYLGFTANEGVRNAYKKGSGNVGDLNLMMVAMMRYAGLKADPVLVSTKSHGIPLFPTINGFNYVVAAVHNQEDTYLMDATNTNAEIGVLNPSVINGYGRLLKDNGTSSWIAMHGGAPSMHTAMVTLNLENGQRLKGESKTRFTGSYAMDFRNSFRNADATSAGTKIREIYRKTEVTDYKFENLDAPGQPVVLDLNFNAPHVEEVAGKIYVNPMTYLLTEENPFKAQEREYPIDFTYPTRSRYLITLNIPENYAVESIPESTAFQMDKNIANYRYTVNQNNNQLQLSVDFFINEAFVAASEYPALQKLYQMIVEKESEKVVLKRI